VSKCYSEYAEIFKQLPAPYALIDLDCLDQNIQAILKRAANLPIRIATKSIRCRWILEYILKSSPQFQGLMTYSAAETAWLANEGFDNLLLAYPSTDKASIATICGQIKAGKKIWLMIDSIEQAQFLAEIAKDSQTIIPICLDIDMSTDYPGLHFGVWRSPLTQPEQISQLAQALLKIPQLKLNACMGYEAQIAGLGDTLGGQTAKNMVIRKLKKNAIAQINARRLRVAKALADLGIELVLFNGGGTGSLESTARDPSVTEVTVGSGFYAPTLFDHYSLFQHQPAALFALPLTRRPAAGIITCYSGGYIASGSIGEEKLPSPYLPKGLTLLAQEGAGEVQTPLKYTGSEKLAIGAPIFFRHAKAGELCERFSHLHLIRGTSISKETLTYRGEGQCFG
jgi:D-serine deaminase-like pyridoxal phosphate-dependent protein